jgi:hypothetical protein
MPQGIHKTFRKRAVYVLQRCGIERSTYFATNWHPPDVRPSAALNGAENQFLGALPPKKGGDGV